MSAWTGDAADEDGGQFGHGGELAGAAHLHVDGQHGGHLLLCRVFVRHGPARLARDKAQLALLRERVHFVDHAVDVKRQAVALRGHFGMKGGQLGSAARLVDTYEQAQEYLRLPRLAVGAGVDR